ncbi:hypothetical protein M8J77_014984 [Diaphorina citri]|nr:hypothetical protein M8J77_014984 [Diaphorina citri]
MWFCLSLNPLSNMLNSTNKGYSLNRNVEQKITHLLYMDDIKLYAKDKDELRSMLEISLIFLSDNEMKFGIEKCATLEVKRGKIHDQENINLTSTPMVLPTLDQSTNEMYKYLGVKQALVFNKSEAKDSVINTYTTRLKKILATSLNGANKIHGVFLC